MANESLISAIEAVITDNGNNEITGQILQDLLTQNIVPVLGADRSKGVATPTTNPGTPESEVYYTATQQGTYANFDGIVIDYDGVSTLTYRAGVWELTTLFKSSSDINDADQTKVAQVSVVKEISQNVDNKADLQEAVNAFNKDSEDLDPGNYTRASDGEHEENELFASSGKIRIPEGSLKLLLTYSGQIAFFDESENYISGNIGNGVVNDSVSIPSLAKFVDVSIAVENGGLDKFMLIFGEEFPAKYVPFKIIKKELLQITNNEIVEPINGDNIKNEAITDYKVKKGSLSASRLAFMKASSNLLNPNEIVSGLIDGSGGVSPNESYNTSGFIDVSSVVNGGSIYGESEENGHIFRQYAFFDENFKFIKDSFVSTTDTPSSVQKFLNSKYFRTSFNTNQSSVHYSLKPIDEYEEYSYKVPSEMIEENIEFEKLNSILGKNAKIISSSSLLSGVEFTMSNFPWHLKKGISMSISCEFDSFSGYIEFGKGREQTNGDWIRIDDTNIYWYSKGSATSVRGTYEHGLTISTYINASLTVNYLGEIYVILQSLDGMASVTFGNRNEANYIPFMYTSGQAVNNVKLTATSNEFQNPVWVFTDSYGGVVDNRWPGQMRDLGYFNFLLNGIGGQTSNLAYNDLLKCLDFGTPKYLLWFLGMNDTNEIYESTLNSLIELCVSKNINLILATIPTVPTRDKEVIKSIVELSGYRYVDFYKAVGATPTGNWYSGYLSPDEVHPDILGAKALASQVLVDFPEIMQYGVI